jgi:hypothetical protein
MRPVSTGVAALDTAVTTTQTIASVISAAWGARYATSLRAVAHVSAGRSSLASDFREATRAI